MISYRKKNQSGINPDFRNHPQKQSGSAKSFPSHTLVHPKLELTEPGDSDEMEADAAANEVMSGKVCRKISGGGVGGGMAVSSQMESQLNHLQGGGQSMPAGLRDMMERGFDRDFSQVRLHTDSEAAGLSTSINAKAFTHGNDIYFNRGQFSPETSEGQRLVAHELAHVAQGGGKVGRCLLTDESQRRIADTNMRKYIKEPDWIKDEVLGESLFERLVCNYYIDPKEDKKPVTIVVFNSRDAACKVEEKKRYNEEVNLNKCATTENSKIFFIDNVKGPISSLLKDSKNERVVMIQAPEGSIDLMKKVESVCKEYGPIKDVVIVGHGNSGSISLNKGFSLTTDNVAYVLLDRIVPQMQKLDKDKQYEFHHSIIYMGCLTDSDASDNGLSQYSRSYIDKTYSSLDVNVQGNETSVVASDEILYYDAERKLILKNTKDSTVTHIDGEKYDFAGCYPHPDGVLKSIIGKLETNTKSLYIDPDSFDNYCTDGEIEMIGLVKDKKEEIKIDIEDIVNFVKDELRYRPNNKPFLIDFLKRIDRNDKAVFDEFWRRKIIYKGIDIRVVYAQTYKYL